MPLFLPIFLKIFRSRIIKIAIMFVSFFCFSSSKRTMKPAQYFEQSTPKSLFLYRKT